MATMTSEIDRAEVEATVAAFEKLRQAIEAVNTELEKLGSIPHGGITINAVGAIVHCEVKPAPVSSPITHSIINAERTIS